MTPIEWVPVIPAGEARETFGELAWYEWDKAVAAYDGMASHHRTVADDRLCGLRASPHKEQE